MKKQPAHDYYKRTGRKPITATMASESQLRTQKWLQNGCNGWDLKIPTSNPLSFWTEQDILLYIRMHQNRMIYGYQRKLSKCVKDENDEYSLNLVIAKGIMKYGKNYVSRETGAFVTRSLKELGAICSVYGDIVTDDEEMGQLTIADVVDGLELSDLGRPTLHTTGCSRTGCVLCGFGCHLEKPGRGRFEMLKETHPNFHKLLFILKNNGVTYAEAIDWVNEHGNLNIRY